MRRVIANAVERWQILDVVGEDQDSEVRYRCSTRGASSINALPGTRCLWGMKLPDRVRLDHREAPTVGLAVVAKNLC